MADESFYNKVTAFFKSFVETPFHGGGGSEEGTDSAHLIAAPRAPCRIDAQEEDGNVYNAKQRSDLQRITVITANTEKRIATIKKEIQAEKAKIKQAMAPYGNRRNRKLPHEVRLAVRNADTNIKLKTDQLRRLYDHQTRCQQVLHNCQVQIVNKEYTVLLEETHAQVDYIPSKYDIKQTEKVILAQKKVVANQERINDTIESGADVADMDEDDIWAYYDEIADAERSSMAEERTEDPIELSGSTSLPARGARPLYEDDDAFLDGDEEPEAVYG